MKRTALAVMRTQPLHEGHCGIITKMCQSAETVIIGLGSADKHGTRSNPFAIELRIQMIKNVFGTRVKCIPMHDLGATPLTSDWIDYVLDRLKKMDLPEPTDYYTGSKADAIWYASRFHHPSISDPNGELTGTELAAQFGGPVGYNDFRRLHIIDRDSNPIPSATELRTFIELGSNEWKQWIPAVNHDMIEKNYPQEFLVGKNNK